jgi:hypothetical protein
MGSSTSEKSLNKAEATNFDKKEEKKMIVPSRCCWSAVAAIMLVATLWIQAPRWPVVVVAQERGNTSERRPLVLDRSPVRNIADPNPVFRAVVIDSEHGEVFMANDKESAGTSVLVYPTQFPPRIKLWNRVEGLLARKPSWAWFADWPYLWNMGSCIR